LCVQVAANGYFLADYGVFASLQALLVILFREDRETTIESFTAMPPKVNKAAPAKAKASKAAEAAEASLTEEQKAALERRVELLERAADQQFSSDRPDQFPRLAPSKAILTCSGQDIYRKGAAGQKKGRYLFSFPGKLAPLTTAPGGKIGQLERLDTLNPVLHMDFPQGRLTFHGTIASLASTSKLLTLQCNPVAVRGAERQGGGGALTSSSNPAVLVEDVFDKVIVFSEVGAQELSSIGRPNFNHLCYFITTIFCLLIFAFLAGRMGRTSRSKSSSSTTDITIQRTSKQQT
jgi:hypothetical protein